MSKVILIGRLAMEGKTVSDPVITTRASVIIIDNKRVSNFILLCTKWAFQIQKLAGKGISLDIDWYPAIESLGANFSWNNETFTVLYFNPASGSINSDIRSEIKYLGTDARLLIGSTLWDKVFRPGLMTMIDRAVSKLVCLKCNVMIAKPDEVEVFVEN